MDFASAQRHQEIMASQSLNSMLVCTNTQNQQEEKKPRPAEQALKCPRCDSANTKFCYYNNYSLSQPRYFCKSCRRYWTKGGTLRNVPVGGGCRKNKRSSSASRRSHTPEHLQGLMTTSSSSSISPQMLSPLASYEHHHSHHPPSAHDLSLAFARGNLPIIGNSHFDLFGNNGSLSILDSLRNGNVSNNGLHLYNGYGGIGTLGEMYNNGGNVSHQDHQMGMQFDLFNHQNHQEIMSNPSSGSSTPTIKQEMGDNRVLLNYIMNGEIENSSHRESWNSAGVLGSSWHHLINSPLM